MDGSEEKCGRTFERESYTSVYSHNTKNIIKLKGGASIE